MQLLLHKYFFISLFYILVVLKGGEEKKGRVLSNIDRYISLVLNYIRFKPQKIMEPCFMLPYEKEIPVGEISSLDLTSI